MKEKIWLSLAKMGGREQDFVKEAFDTNWVVPLGPNVDGFESDLADFLGQNRYVVALSSGTAAIHLGLIILGVKPEDEVICQSFTFAATANPIVYLGAKPVFVDSEKDTLNIDPELLREAIEDRFVKTGKYPKAIIPVHLYGMPAKMNEIMSIANQYNIPVLEDAAEAIGSEYFGQKCGTFGEIGILSFNGNKMITTSGGGALICRNNVVAEKVNYYATQARDKAPHYQHSEIGYNYRMSNICAGIGRGQMFILDSHISRRREINRYYRNALSHLDGITVQKEPSIEFNSNFWLTTLLIEKSICGFTNLELSQALTVENIESRHLWKPMHLQPVFSNSPYYGNGISDYYFENGICIPSGPTLTDEDLFRIVGCIISLFKKK